MSNKKRKRIIFLIIPVFLTFCAIVTCGLVYIFFTTFRSSYEDVQLWVRSVDWSPDGSHLVGGSADKCFTVWDVLSGEIVGGITGFPGQVRKVDWSPDGQIILTGNDGNNNIELWDSETMERLAMVDVGHSLGYTAWSPDGKYFASDGKQFGIYIWESKTNSLVNSFTNHHSNQVTGIVWSPDGSMLASSSADSSVIIWDFGSGKAIHQFKAHRRWVNGLDWSPDGNLIASGADDREVIIWNSSTNEIVTRLKEHSLMVYSVAWSPKDDLLATGGLDDNIILWNTQNWQPITKLASNSEGVLFWHGLLRETSLQLEQVWILSNYGILNLRVKIDTGVRLQE